jgi:hypothetical protein
MKKCFLAIALCLYTSFGYSETSIENGSAEVIVHRSPTCSCCEKWVEHLKQNNFTVKDIISEDVQSVKTKYGVPKEMASCHTAIVNGYVVEGHVPATDVKMLLKNKPKIVGISVPGMPKGTPGMEMGGKKDAYQVLSFDTENHIKVFNSFQSE